MKLLNNHHTKTEEILLRQLRFSRRIDQPARPVSRLRERIRERELFESTEATRINGMGLLGRF